MEINKAAAALIAALCVGAGAGGAYLASRASEPATSTLETASPDGAPAAVEQSEGIVGPTPLNAEAPLAAAPSASRVAPPAETVRRPARRTAAVAPAVVPPRDYPEVVERPEPRVTTPPQLEPATVREPELTRAPEPPAPQFEELVISADSVLGLQIDGALTSERARVEDEVTARVTRDVRVGDRVAIPAGSRAEGEVTLVERGGKLRDRARLGVRFTSVVLADGTRIPIESEAIYREGDAPGGESTAKIGGGAIGGAIIGGILGGAKGAAIGGSIGAGAGTAAVVAGGRNAATFPAGTPVTVRITEPATVTVEK